MRLANRTATRGAARRGEREGGDDVTKRSPERRRRRPSVVADRGLRRGGLVEGEVQRGGHQRVQELTTNATSPARRRGVAGGVDSKRRKAVAGDRKSVV